jgi:hypothetical protein
MLVLGRGVRRLSCAVLSGMYLAPQTPKMFSSTMHRFCRLSNSALVGVVFPFARSIGRHQSIDPQLPPYSTWKLRVPLRQLLTVNVG